MGIYISNRGGFMVIREETERIEEKRSLLLLLYHQKQKDGKTQKQNVIQEQNFNEIGTESYIQKLSGV